MYLLSSDEYFLLSSVVVHVLFESRKFRNLADVCSSKYVGLDIFIIHWYGLFESINNNYI